MANPDPIADDETILRHIRGGPTYQQPPGPRITSANFFLRTGESGISATRAAMTSADRLLLVVGGNSAAGSRVAAARVGDIRTLGMDVVSVPTDDDPGHCEIRSGSANLNAKSVQRGLAQLFRFVPTT